MLELYINFVKTHPYYSAALQFSVLGTLGEVLSLIIKNKGLKINMSLWTFIGKVLSWAVLGIFIKIGFKAMKAFTNAVIHTPHYPSILKRGIGYAFSLSLFTNLFFGPQMMVFHRIEDNLVEGKWSFNGITKAWATLIWFWIPAHTITFSLPSHYQIGLAALWSVVLGIILGFSKK